MGLFNFGKKKGISARSANFARLVKYLCLQSGIPIPTQLNITKSLARDYIDNTNRNLGDFIFLDADGAKQYLIKNGMSTLDADIFWSIIQANKDNFISI